MQSSADQFNTSFTSVYANGYANVIKSFEMTSNSKHKIEKQETKDTETKKKTQKDKNLVLRKKKKKYVENADLDKAVLSKITSTRERRSTISELL